MVATLVSLVLLAYGLLLIFGCAAAWRFFIGRLANREPLLTQRPFQPANWGLLDVLGGAAGVFLLANFLVVIFLGLMGSGFGNPLGQLSMEARVAAIWGMVLAELFVCGVLTIAIILRGGIGQFFGTSLDRFWNEVWIGVVTFAALCVPVLMIQVLTAYLIPYEHPLIQLLVESPELWILIPVVFSAVVVAPVCEEFAFRLVLQGWLEDLLEGRLRGSEILVGRFQSFSPTMLDDTDLVVPLADSPAETQEDAFTDNPYHSPAAPYSEQSADTAEIPHQRPLHLLPILVSSAIFAMLHLGQGAAPIPLFFLALGLGYVYQRTRTLTACIVIHMLLNGQSMVILLLQIFFGDSLPADMP